MHSEKETRDWKLRHCRLYYGSKKNGYEDILHNGLSFREPYESYKEDKSEDEINEILAIFYANESNWVRADRNHHFSRHPHAVSEFEYHLGKDFETEDGTPRDLQVMLYNGFLQFIDGVYHRFDTQYEIDLFKRYYREYYQPLLTPVQKREKERRAVLIDKCTYYKGEKENPWMYCYAPVLVWRKKIWTFEKEWADAMVCSYRCPQSSKKLIQNLVMEEFFKAKGIPISLLSFLLTKEQEETKKKVGPIEAIQYFEKYKSWAPLGRDHRMFFAYYLGEDNPPFEYNEDNEYLRMGWSQERLQLESFQEMDLFETRKFQREHRGKEGIWGWYADPKYSNIQKSILFFNICNWGTWCPYCDEDKLAEEYLNYHYPGDGRSKHSDKFYHDAALEVIKDNSCYCNVRKCGMYEEKRVYRPIFTPKYKEDPMPIGLPLVILVNEDGNTECIQDQRTFHILKSLRKKTKHEGK